MQPDDFRTWRKALGWKQKDAADRLGLKKRVIQYYEKGDRDGKPVEIPLTVELACLALSLGFEGYDGGPVEKQAGATPAPEPTPDAELPADAPADAAPETLEAPEATPPAKRTRAPKSGAARAPKRKTSAKTPRPDTAG